eukprot:s1013_g7.t1
MACAGEKRSFSVFFGSKPPFVSESATANTEEFRVGITFLPSFCAGERNAARERGVASTASWAPSGIADCNVHVHVGNADIAGDTGPVLSAITGQGAFQS